MSTHSVIFETTAPSCLTLLTSCVLPASSCSCSCSRLQGMVIMMTSTAATVVLGHDHVRQYVPQVPVLRTGTAGNPAINGSFKVVGNTGAIAAHSIPFSNDLVLFLIRPNPRLNFGGSTTQSQDFLLVSHKPVKLQHTYTRRECGLYAACFLNSCKITVLGCSG